NETSVLAAFDLAPSLLALARIDPPSNVKFDGEDFLDTLLGKTDAARQGPIFWRRPPDRKQTGNRRPLPDLATRHGDWKLLCNYDGSQPELYDLAHDRAEQTNLADQHPAVVARLTAPLLAWHQSMPADRGATFEAEPRPATNP